MQEINDVYTELSNRLENYETMEYEEYKYSFIIVKPNGARHLQTYIRELEKEKIDIIDFFAIHNHEEVNLALHLTLRERKHILPINKMFKDFYGDSAVLILIGNRNITYEDFVKKVFEFKWKARKLVETKYISYVFDTSDILKVEKDQELKILDMSGKEIGKYEMNDKGSFMVALPNSLHSPDNSVERTVQELQVLRKMMIIYQNNSIPQNVLEDIVKYNSMEMIKDML